MNAIEQAAAKKAAEAAEADAASQEGEKSQEQVAPSPALKPAADAKPPQYFSTAGAKGPGKPINENRYQCPSAPSSYIFKDGTRFPSPDGIIYASNEQQEKELQEAVQAGNIFPYNGKPFQGTQVTPER